MTNEGRCCGGRCGGAEVGSFSRREFLEMLAATTAGWALNYELAGAEREAARPPLSLPKPAPGRYPLTPPRVYRGEHLAAVGMPLGGIGTGSVWLDGRGQLAVWQIFNNQNEMRIPDTFFAVSVRSGEGPTTTRALQTAAARGLPPIAALEFEGGYPIAQLTFQDPLLPVGIQLEAFNPLIPLDTRNSSVPCAIFRLTAHNPGETAADVLFAASLQNAVGSQGPGGIQNVKSSGYGGNRNRIVREASCAAVTMDKTSDPVQPGPVKVRAANGREVAGPELIWLDGRRGLDKEVAEALARVANQGGAALVEGSDRQLLRRNSSAARRKGGPLSGRPSVRRFRARQLRGVVDRRGSFREAAVSRHRGRPTAGERLCRRWAGQHVHRRRWTDRQRYVATLPDRAPLHRLPDRRRQPCGPDLRESPRGGQSGPDRCGEES